MNKGFDKDTLIFFITLVIVMGIVFFRVNSNYDESLKDTKLQRQRVLLP